MNEKEIKLLMVFLEEYMDELGNHGCNDWNFPKTWTQKEREELVREAYVANGDPENFDPDDENCMNIPDFFAVMAIKSKLEKMIGQDALREQRSH